MLNNSIPARSRGRTVSRAVKLAGAGTVMFLGQIGAATAHPGHGIDSPVHLHAPEVFAYALALAGLSGAIFYIAKHLSGHRKPTGSRREKRSERSQ